MSAEGGAHDPKDEYAELDSAELAFFDRYQDQLMFGSDYMESTFSWLKSYRQRLDMFLPYSERWPLPDGVKRKYYHANARRLLRRPGANYTPAAHPGFTVTRIVGDTVTLDGRASFGPAGSLRYAWRQTEGATVRLRDDTTSRPRFVATTAGDLAFELVVRSDSSASRPRSVRVNVISTDSAFQEDSGRVVIEAEHFERTVPHNGRSWTLARDQAGFESDGYVLAGPTPASIDEPGRLRATSPELRYTMWIQQPGTYVVYARGMAPDTAHASVHFGLDNEEARLADRVGRFPVGRWGWARNAFEWDAQFQMMDTTLAVLNIVEPGPHVLNVWMHHAGVMLDRIMLVRAPNPEVERPLFDPGTTPGPAESQRRSLRR